MMRMNKAFVARWNAERLSEVLPEVVLHPRLAALVQAPFVRVDGGLLLESLVTGSPGREAFQDATGYEAFINKFHVDDWTDEAGFDSERLRVMLQQGTKAAIVLADRLRREGRYQVLLSLDLDSEWPSMTLRFFGRREGERWSAEDLDSYQLDEVLTIDT